MLSTLSGRSFIEIQYSSFLLFPVAYPFRIATQLQYYVKGEKCKVNDVMFLSGCEAHAINLGNKNVKIGIFTGSASVRSKNIFTDICRYPTGKHEINAFTTVETHIPMGECNATVSAYSTTYRRIGTCDSIALTC